MGRCARSRCSRARCSWAHFARPRRQDLTGSKLEKLCELAAITLNKNAVHGDVSAVSPGGVRVGTAALTSRGFKEADFVAVAGFLHRAVQIALTIQAGSGKALKDFVAALDKHADIVALKHEVEAFAAKFPMPGFSTDDL